MQFTSLHELDATDGTVKLRRATAAASGFNTSKDDIILHPTPSADNPNDPLNWPKWKKHLAFGTVCTFTFFTNYGLGGLAPAFPAVAGEFDRSQTDAALLLIWPVFALGLFNFFWVPMAQYFGKRPVFVAATAIYLACCIWGARAESFASLLWSSNIAAFAGSSTEALGAATVNDLYFLHERSSKMSIYITCISWGNSVGPLVCGFIVESLGWRWHKWITAIFVGVNLLAVVFFFEETRFLSRDYSHEGDADTHSPQRTPSQHTSIEDDEAAKTPRVSDTYLTAMPPVISQHPAYHTPPTSKRHSYLRQLSLGPAARPQTSLLRAFLRPFPLLAHPAILLSFLTYALSLAWVVFINATAPFLLSAPPYSWHPSSLGLINISGIIGNLLGALLGGPLVDRLAARLAHRNQGRFAPEMHLPLLVIPTVLVPAGCLLYGYGAGRHLPWPAAFVGFAAVSFGLTAAPAITMTYVCDAALPVAPDALLLVNGLKNIFAFALLWANIPWVLREGYVGVEGTMAGLYVAVVGGGGFVMWSYGARAREIVGQWKVVLC